MKYVLAVVLSALLLTFTTPHPNNSTKASKPTESPGQPLAKSNEQPVKPVEPQKTVKTMAVATAIVEPEQPQIKTVAKPLSDKQQLMQQAGIPESDWNAVDYIVSHESSWRFQAKNASSGAYGLCQALPASKMASAGADYMTNPVTQLRWCHDYASNRYTGWWSAFAFWQANRWW